MHLEVDPANEPDDGAVLAGATREDTVAELFGLCDEFFRCPASPQVHAELRRFLISRGYHPVASWGWFIDTLGFAASRPRYNLSEDEPSPGGTRVS